MSASKFRFAPDHNEPETDRVASIAHTVIPCPEGIGCIDGLFHAATARASPFSSGPDEKTNDPAGVSRLGPPNAQPNLEAVSSMPVIRIRIGTASVT